MFNNNLLKLARAMAEFEGWNCPASAAFGNDNGSVSFSNHNPGNLRSSPFQVSSKFNFAVFINDEVGFFALCFDIWKKARGETSTSLTPKSTLYELIKVYSGESIDVVTNYASFVESRTGLKMTMPIGDIIK